MWRSTAPNPLIATLSGLPGARKRGAAMPDGEMIDEASRKLVMVAAARGQVAGLARTQRFEPPG